MLSTTIDRTSWLEAVDLLNRAIALDPNFSEALAALALTSTFDFHNRWTEDPDGSLKKAGDLAARAVAANPNEPLAYVASAVVAQTLGNLEEARGFIEKALQVDPNNPFAISNRGNIAVYSGQPEEAIPYLEQAIRLDPAFSHQYLHFLGTAHLLLGHYETAATVFQERIRLFPSTDASRAYLASALGHLGDNDRAREVWAELMKVNPKYVLSERLGRLPYANPAHRETIIAGVAKAGLPT